MSRHDKTELRSAILKVLTYRGHSITTKSLTDYLLTDCHIKVTSATVLKHCYVMEKEGQLSRSPPPYQWSIPFRSQKDVGTVYQSPERKLFSAAADLVQSILDRTSVVQNEYETAKQVRDGLQRLVWMADQGMDHGLAVEQRGFGKMEAPRFVIANRGDEALFKIGRP